MIEWRSQSGGTSLGPEIGGREQQPSNDKSPQCPNCREPSRKNLADWSNEECGDARSGSHKEEERQAA